MGASCRSIWPACDDDPGLYRHDLYHECFGLCTKCLVAVSHALAEWYICRLYSKLDCFDCQPNPTREERVCLGHLINRHDRWVSNRAIYWWIFCTDCRNGKCLLDYR